MKGFAPRREFTEDALDSSRQWFALFPSAWRHSEVPFAFRDACNQRLGGMGVLALLPILVHNALQRECFRYSQVELARLTGVGAETIQKARGFLARVNVATTQVKLHQNTGLPHLHWQVSTDFIHSLKDSIKEGKYFYFSLAMLHGGQWPMLSHVGKAIYLAAGFDAHVHSGPLEEHRLLREVLHPDANRDDLERGIEWAAAIRSVPAVANRAGLRVAHTSAARLADITGLNRQSIRRYLASVRHPKVWGADYTADLETLRYSPLWAYPTRTRRGVIVHFRDHVSHWPWEILNQSGLKP